MRGIRMNGKVGSEAGLSLARASMVGRWTLTALAAAALLASSGCLPGENAPKNIILLIGDGMGVAQVTAAKVAFGELEMERLPYGGLATTFPEGDFVTDSAASGTALATGQKTICGAISMTPADAIIKTALEYAEDNGMATGLVVTCSITHATPAVFATHIESRDREFEIAEQLAAGDVDVLFGGGAGYFTPTGMGGMRTDHRDLLAGMRERMTVVRDLESFHSMGDVGAAAFLYAEAHPGTADTRPVALSELTERAIDILSKDSDGFFMMVEGSQIDWACHENDKEYLLAEMADFDAAVGAALDFAERDGRTLVIVTADHETGGLAVDEGSVPDEWLGPVKWSSGHHTAAMVPVLVYGPGGAALGGIMDNTDIGAFLIKLVSER
jgi:alkaline phosphatase